VDGQLGEIPLLVLVVIASIGFWALLAISLIAYLRGNGVRLGPEQFPEIHERVEALAQSAGLERAPEAYALQERWDAANFAAHQERTRTAPASS
jgi:hypothetical protein